MLVGFENKRAQSVGQIPQYLKTVAYFRLSPQLLPPLYDFCQLYVFIENERRPGYSQLWTLCRLAVSENCDHGSCMVHEGSQ